MKVCLIGCRGHQGYVTAGLSLRPESRVVAVSAGTDADSVDDLVSSCSANGEAPRVYHDCRRMLDEEMPDVVSIAGPFEDRSAMCIDAFRRGIHVFAEKPVAITEAQLDELESAHETSDVHFAAMMGLRYDPAFYTAWQSVRSGSIGRVNLITSQKSYKLGTRPRYYRRRETYGGTIPWVGSHAIDLIHWFSQQGFASVMASQTRRDNKDHGDLEMAALCQFTLSDGSLASINLDYYRPPNSPTHGDDRIRIAGSEGVIEVRHARVHLIRDRDEEPATACPRQIFADFLDHVAGAATALVKAPETFAVTRACLLAQRSADTHSIVHF